MALFWQLAAHITLAVLLAGTIIVMSHLFGQRGRKGAIKDSPYECGIQTKVSAQPPFPIKFSLVALLFVLFDVELVILLPWVISFQSSMASHNALAFLVGGLSFMAIVGAGLFYEIRKGGLEWDK